MGLHALLWGYLYSLHVDDVRTSQETNYGPPWPVMGIALLLTCRSLYLTGNTLWASMACYGDSFTLDIMGLHGMLWG
jgi:hypothetical protein